MTTATTANLTPIQSRRAAALDTARAILASRNAFGSGAVDPGSVIVAANWILDGENKDKTEHQTHLVASIARVLVDLDATANLKYIVLRMIAAALNNEDWDEQENVIDQFRDDLTIVRAIKDSCPEMFAPEDTATVDDVEPSTSNTQENQ